MNGNCSDVADLLPHGGGMVLLERVAEWDMQQIRCTAISHRAATNPLRCSGRLPALAGIEYAAGSPEAQKVLDFFAKEFPKDFQKIRFGSAGATTQWQAALEEIGALFGDEAHVAAHWYNITEEEKEKIAQNALQLTKSGCVPEEPGLKPSVIDVESHDGSNGEKEKLDDRRVEHAGQHV